MGTINPASLETRIQKLKAENRSLRERLTSIKKENLIQEKSMRNRDIIFNSMAAGIVIIQQGKVMEMNEILLEQLGYGAEEVIGRDFMDFIRSDQRGYVRGLHDIWESGKMAPDQYDAPLVTRDGKTIYCEVRVKHIRLKNRKTFLLNLTRLEQRKELEKEEIQSSKEEALITMASVLTSEFNRYFNSLMDNIIHIRAAYSDNNNLAEALKEVENTLYGALSINRELKAIAGAENDKRDMISFDLNEVVKGAVAYTAQAWKEGPEKHGEKIDLKTYLRSSSPVKGEPKEIKDVIIDIITNAVRAMPDGGEILITTEDNAGYAHIYIQDSGIGISDQSIDRIFDPFFTTKGNDSMGLGLSRSYAIIKKHRGDINVSSQEGQGAIFHIRLPRTKQDQKSKPKADRKKIKDAQILIVQDKDVARELLSHSLTSKGCKVNTAANGLEGLGELKKKKYHLVIADTELLGTEGNIFIIKSRKMNPESSIVLIKGDEEGVQFNQDDKPDADLNIMKPIDMNRAVKQILELLMARQ
ncbi:ATP-binding protein [Thermodesulfobacteriota bacterium]